MEKDIEFKNYKEKQEHYRNILKQERMVWVSTEPNRKKNSIIKGRTYVKPKEVIKHDS